MCTGNGTIDFDEFLQMMSKWQTQRSRSSAVDQSRSEEDEMRQAFRVFDIDGNGLIDERELLQTMRNLGENLTEKDVKAMIKAADQNGDEKIDYEGKGQGHWGWGRNFGGKESVFMGLGRVGIRHSVYGVTCKVKVTLGIKLF
jgi:hypothetical protein